MFPHYRGVVAWFRISFAHGAFLRLLKSRSLALETMTVDEGVAAMIEFYREHRAQHTRLDEDGDMLLLQWSAGALDVTRQLIRSGDTDNPIMQLSLTFSVDGPTPETGNVWHSDPTAPIEVPAFFSGEPTGVTLVYEAA